MLKMNGRVKKISLLLIAITIIAFVFLFSYADIISTTQRSLNFLDYCFSFGNIRNYNFESPLYIPVHIVFAVWDFILFLINKFIVTFNIENVAVLWNKILINIIFIINVLQVKKIISFYDEKNLENWDFLLLTSLLLVAAVYDMEQYDCIGLFFGLDAIIRFLKNNCEFTNKIMLEMSLACCFKGIFIVFPVILIFLKEKKISLLIKKIIQLVIPVLLLFLVGRFISASAEMDGSSLEKVFFIKKILYSKLEWGTFDISVNFLIIFIILIICHEIKIETNIDLCRKAFSYTFLVYFVLMAFGLGMHIQWNIYMVLFLYLMCAYSPTDFIKNSLLIFIFEICLLVQQSVTFNEVLFDENRFSSFFNAIFCKTHYLSVIDRYSVKELFEVYGFNQYMSVLTAFIISIALYIFYINNKKDNVDIECFGEVNKSKYINSLMIIRTLSILFYLFIYFFMYFII